MASTIQTIFSFPQVNSSSQLPLPSLVEASTGDLYGVTVYGGSSGYGSIYRLPKGSNQVSVLTSFDLFTGVSPVDLIQDPESGTFYGVTAFDVFNSAGTIFKYNKGDAKPTTLATFNGANGNRPVKIVLDQKTGDLYGQTVQGGANNNGALFKLPHGSANIELLASFDSFAVETDQATGLQPFCDLILDANGNLFGATPYGGNDPDHDGFGSGTIFELIKGDDHITPLASFNGVNGSNPLLDLVSDENGNIYGSCIFGGPNGSTSGTIFRYDQQSKTIIDIADFNGSNGSYPVSLIRDNSGNFYGTTFQGGANSKGTLFRIAAGSSQIEVLDSFTGTSPPTGGKLKMGEGGVIYGGTFYGGENSGGSLFKVVVPIGTVSGAVFDDSNGNGVRDAGEAPLTNVTVYLDQNLNGQPDASESKVKSDASGNYKFDLVPSTYNVRVVAPSGYRKSKPTGGPGYSAVLAANQVARGNDFGLTTKIYLAGKVFNDANSNGTQDAGEMGIASVVVNVKSSGATVATRTTDAAGFWQVKGLSAGTGEVDVVLPSGFTTTNPQSGKYVGSANSGQQIGNLNFGLHSSNVAASPLIVGKTSVLRAISSSIDLLIEDQIV